MHHEDFECDHHQALFKTCYSIPHRSVFTVIDEEVCALRMSGQPPLDAKDNVDNHLSVTVRTSGFKPDGSVTVAICLLAFQLVGSSIPA